VDLRAGPHRGRVPGQAHDGHLGARPVQGHPRPARARLGPLPRRELRGRDRRDRDLDGEPTRDAHLRSADFFDVDNHPKITFSGHFTERTGGTTFKGAVQLTIRDITRTVPLDVRYLGDWTTPFWDGAENRGSMRRIGFVATARIDRHDFGVSWQDELPNGGVVVSNEIHLTLDVEAINLEDLERTGAIEYYRA
jgi:YceI-like domain